MKAAALLPDQLARPQLPDRPPFIRWFADIRLEDLGSVGGKNASLGEMYRELAQQGVKVPNGFAITAEAYRAFLECNDLDSQIEETLRDVNPRDIENLHDRASRVRQLILSTNLPPELELAIVEAYTELSAGEGERLSVAVRSSATAEDLPDASFAGQQETYLNVQGAAALLHTCRRCFASLFTDRGISYRVDKGYSHAEIALSIGVQRMVRSDLGSSGVMFSIDTETGFRDAILINAAYGLGENVVQGAVNPDEYYVFKPTLERGFRPILSKVTGSKEFKMIYDGGGGRRVKNVPVSRAERAQFAISDEDILTLARWACLIERHYSARRGRPTPMDIEWAKDGNTGELFIVQARPETVHSQRKLDFIETFHLQEHGRPLVSGRSVGGKIATGVVRVIRDVHSIDKLQDGEILVTEKTDPDWEPIMKKAAAIVTNRGGRTCHAAIVSRELGVPAIVGCERATDILQDGQKVTVCCAEGDLGFVYEGSLPFTVERTNLKTLVRPKTKVMMNVGNPDEAFSLSFIPNDGVGLAREEFIVSTYIKAHPMALLHFHELENPDAQEKIAELAAGYPEKAQYFVDKLAHGVAMIAAAFYPKPVIVRLSDFKTNEYAHLIGGSAYEPHEENPMLGFRGASRYYDVRYRRAFALECQAMKMVRDEMGLTNLKLMVPFCRTVEEGRLVLAEMEKHGLRRGENELEIYVMCEIPSNVILAEEFAEIFDGFSIGSNDLTQLVLGVDRDSEIVSEIFDERNAAVKKMISHVIAVCRAKGRKIGICGQAPSDYPEFAEFLVEQGVDSISLNPDTVLKTTRTIAEKERALETAAAAATA